MKDIAPLHTLREMMERFQQFMNGGNKRVLVVHCKGGKGRQVSEWTLSRWTCERAHKKGRSALLALSQRSRYVAHFCWLCIVGQVLLYVLGYFSPISGIPLLKCWITLGIWERTLLNLDVYKVSRQHLKEGTHFLISIPNTPLVMRPCSLQAWLSVQGAQPRASCNYPGGQFSTGDSKMCLGLIFFVDTYITLVV